MEVSKFEELAQTICNEFVGTTGVSYKTMGEKRVIEDYTATGVHTLGKVYRIECVYMIDKHDRLEIVYDCEHEDKIYARHLTDEKLFSKNI